MFIVFFLLIMLNCFAQNEQDPIGSELKNNEEVAVKSVSAKSCNPTDFSIRKNEVKPMLSTDCRKKEQFNKMSSNDFEKWKMEKLRQLTAQLSSAKAKTTKNEAYILRLSNAFNTVDTSDLASMRTQYDKACAKAQPRPLFVPNVIFQINGCEGYELVFERILQDTKFSKTSISASSLEPVFNSQVRFSVDGVPPESNTECLKNFKLCPQLGKSTCIELNKSFFYSWNVNTGQSSHYFASDAQSSSAAPLSCQ